MPTSIIAPIRAIRLSVVRVSNKPNITPVKANGTENITTKGS